MPIGGRSLTLLDKTYRLDEYMTQRSHKHILQRLKSMLPKDSKAIIVTDAGFRCPWFKLVLSLNWDFIGRVRNQTLYQQDSDTPWLPIKLLYQRATASAKYLFDGLLAKANPVKCHFYMLKQSKKYRVKKNLVGKKIQCSASKKHTKRESEPWLIASSLSNANYLAKHVINSYKLRMQIEESFRDLKNTKNGFSCVIAGRTVSLDWMWRYSLQTLLCYYYGRKGLLQSKRKYTLTFKPTPYDIGTCCLTLLLGGNS